MGYQYLHDYHSYGEIPVEDLHRIREVLPMHYKLA